MDLDNLKECFKAMEAKFTITGSPNNSAATFADTIISGINDSVREALKDIDGEKNHKLFQVNNKWSHIKQAFGETLKAFDTGGYQVVTSAINGYAVANKAIMDVIKSALDIITTLEKTPQFAVEKKADIDELMVKLKNDIEGVRDRINYIDQIVKETADALTMVISELVNAYNEARKNARNALSNLQKSSLMK
ncbi:methyl-accepting chemotaxis sensory transducer, putative [Babesia ovata]|uniref:Methyl-accepting chemotaxis sensory transducer, putative n=1 Tax=Babesia ovata TaxID=189622 RepID=A0A2H6KK29_9APIC|nr:methyl-accepting chemotaxis sensory transducer, putative [Babesia ovata]GBE63341.1 methyl-accepting chemotaxis sensory transducer, putative [Babesia ovata]